MGCLLLSFKRERGESLWACGVLVANLYAAEGESLRARGMLSSHLHFVHVLLVHRVDTVVIQEGVRERVLVGRNAPGRGVRARGRGEARGRWAEVGWYNSRVVDA